MLYRNLSFLPFKTIAASMALLTMMMMPIEKSHAANDTENELIIYTYDSFTSDWGPGPQVEKAFEEKCNCDLKFIGLEDAVSILNRISLEGKNTKADIALGLDQNLISRAQETGLFTTHDQPTDQLDLLKNWKNETFLPFDYGYFSFIYNSDTVTTPPKSLNDLVFNSDLNIVIQDPRTSTPGLGFLLWMKSVFGDKAADAWTKLAPRIVTTTKGWSEAYGMFLQDEADMVLSYTTSPAYHITAEQETKYKAAPFSEGHYQQIEVAAQLTTAKHPKLAQEFLNFMISEDFQSIIPTTNWMLPVKTPNKGLPEAFMPENIHYPTQPLSIAPLDIQKNSVIWIDEWLEAVSQ